MSVNKAVMCMTKDLHAMLACVTCMALTDCAIATSEYIVKNGDTPLGIARNHKVSYERLCELNNKPCDWRLIKVGQKILVPSALPRFSEEQLTSLGTAYESKPNEAKLLNEYGDFALFSGETESDVAFNAASKRVDDDGRRNSLFLRRRTASGKVEWRLLLTSGGDWKDADGMDKWCKACADDIRYCFDVLRASLSKDGRYIWLVCDRHISMYYVVCRFDLRENSLRVLTDGDSADEEPDGTIWVLNKKIYLYDKNGEPDGAAWIEEWITPDGKVVRKGEPKRQEDVLVYDEAVKLRRNERAKEQKGKTK